MKAAIAAAAASLWAGAAAAQGIELVYGPEQTVYGSCRPALTLTNRGANMIDYVEIAVRYRLNDGRIVAAEHKSRYRDGLADPVAPGASRALVVHHDESVPLGAPCSGIVQATIDKVICVKAGGGDCAGELALKPGAGLALPRR